MIRSSPSARKSVFVSFPKHYPPLICPFFKFSSSITVACCRWHSLQALRSKKIVAVMTLRNSRSRVGQITYLFAKNNQPKFGWLFLDVPRLYPQRRLQATILVQMGLQSVRKPDFGAKSGCCTQQSPCTLPVMAGMMKKTVEW